MLETKNNYHTLNAYDTYVMYDIVVILRLLVLHQFRNEYLTKPTNPFVILYYTIGTFSNVCRWLKFLPSRLN